MKKTSILAIVFIIAFLTSCSRTIYYSIGMSQNDFLKQNKKGVIALSETVNSSVYQIGYQPAMMFYFNNGKLYEVKTVSN